MTVKRDYLLKTPAGPSAPKLFLDRRVIPLAVNLLGEVEVALERVSVRTGVRPAVILAGTAGLLSLTLFQLLRGRGAGSRRHRR